MNVLWCPQIQIIENLFDEDKYERTVVPPQIQIIDKYEGTVCPQIQTSATRLLILPPHTQGV